MSVREIRAFKGARCKIFLKTGAFFRKTALP